MIVEKTELSEVQKLCVLSFDEMKIKKCYMYDKANDATLQPYNYVQVAILRGLVGNWKQPIFYDYDCAMSKAKLFEIISFVEKAGFPIVAVVSDLGGGNRALHKELGITMQQTWFLSPVSNQKIYCFADVPHLIKLLRNHFVDDGFLLNSVEINKDIIERVIQLTTSTDLNIAHKISMDTLHVKGCQRQKVKFATKLFSHTISRAITRCGMLEGLSEQNWIVCANFFKDVILKKVNILYLFFYFVYIF
ncbi:hypothetical protein ABEB36_005213 [Hypothenemus hampei]|uniref:Transposable element P transposase n=1 Tax=Hypothenemus hampei TaxID=57062 RepID=A0ABD1F189_HYPHA